jgi:hypothetical protein
LNGPYDVLECASGNSFIVANTRGHNLVKFSRDGAKIEEYGKRGSGNGEFNAPSALTVLPEGGMVVRELGNDRFQVFCGSELRKAWITVCVTLATREWRTSVTTK